MTQLLDHTGAPIRRTSPRREALARVVRSNAVRAKYDAAQPTRHDDLHWVHADGLSAAAANSPEVRRQLRNKSRYECANNSYAAGIIRTLANDVIGTGPTLQMTSGDDAADSEVEMAFWKWMQASRMAEKLRTMRMARAVDGEGFGLLFTNMALRNPVKLDIRLYEADQVARPWGSFSDPLMTDGIVLDDFGNVIAYTLLKQHPGDHSAGGADYDTIPARNMIHLFRADRPGQIRGVPEITASLRLFGHLRDYTFSVLAAARTAADLAALLETQSAVDDPEDLEPLDLFDLEPRSIMTLPRGWRAMQMKAEQPTTTFAMFKREMVLEIARCIGMPYNIAAGDSSGYNYASGRLDHQTYFKQVRVDRTYIENTALEPVFERWWEEAALVGVLPPSLAQGDEIPAHEWRWDGHEHVDPQKEANAQTVRLANHTTTLAKECQREGLDWEDVLRQRAKEQSLMNELGIVAPAAPGQSSDAEDDMDAAIENKLNEWRSRGLL